MADNQDKINVFKDAIKQNLGPVWKYLDDKTVSEILINSASEIFVERKGKLERVPESFADEDTLRAAINSIAQSVGRRISEEEPRLDARLPDGSRFAAVIPPCSRKGSTLSIRKFTNSKISFGDYIKLGAISEDAARFLDVCMFLGKNILVSGGTGSGKTTLLGLLCSRIPKGYRVIVIEDASELQIEYEHVVFFETRQADGQGKGEVSIKDLLKSSLRLRPDRIIVGEVRSSEAIELINAMNTGHKGSMGTVHANNPDDAMVRLEALAQSGDAKISEKALRQQVTSAIDLIIQVSRFSDGSRKVSHISEVRGCLPDGTYDVVPIFEILDMKRTPEGKLEGRVEATGNIPSFMDEIVDNNLPFPRAKFTRAA
ncbi:MAG: CpaF family protein [Bdellovibrionaceae bacterium]|nr:CpaF family protein [Pseudobdellovibrionaceae bacterium]